jgi:hypothetical protein
MPNKIACSFVLNDRFSSAARRIKRQASGMRDSMKAVSVPPGSFFTAQRVADTTLLSVTVCLTEV